MNFSTDEQYVIFVTAHDNLLRSDRVAFNIVLVKFLRPHNLWLDSKQNHYFGFIVSQPNVLYRFCLTKVFIKDT